MLKRLLFLLCTGACALVGFAPSARAAVEWQVLKTLDIEGTPVDVAASLDGQTTFVLTDKGDIFLFGPDGALKEKISLGEPADTLDLTPPRGNMITLVVGSKEKKTVKIIFLETIQKINTADSPFKGPKDAPVTIAVFTDFQ